MKLDVDTLHVSESLLFNCHNQITRFSVTIEYKQYLQ